MGLRVSARGIHVETRAVELSDDPFFLATLFQPQLSSRPENTTPCLAGFLASRNAIPQSSLVVLARQKGHNKIDDVSARQMLHDAVQDEGGHSSPVAKALNECAQDCQGLTTATPVG